MPKRYVSSASPLKLVSKSSAPKHNSNENCLFSNLHINLQPVFDNVRMKLKWITFFIEESGSNNIGFDSFLYWHWIYFYFNSLRFASRCGNHQCCFKWYSLAESSCALRSYIWTLNMSWANCVPTHPPNSWWSSPGFQITKAISLFSQFCWGIKLAAATCVEYGDDVHITWQDSIFP